MLQLLKRPALLLLLTLMVGVAVTPAVEKRKIPEGFSEEDWDLLRSKLTEVDVIAAALQSDEEDIDVEEAIGAGGFQIVARDSLVHDPKSQWVFSRDRARIKSGNFELEADRLIIDVRLQEVQAEGNVKLIINESEIEATRMFYNLKTREGVAHNIDGKSGEIYFRANPDEKIDEPSFQQISSNQYLYRKSRFTTDDFPRPMYEIKAKEVILFPEDRIFMRAAIVYVREIPVLYLPSYNTSLKEKQAWHFVFGSGGDLGNFVLGEYQAKYHNLEPGFDDEGEMVERTKGDMKYKFDYMSDRGFGYGLKHGYKWNFDRHAGLWELYGINDEDYEVDEDGDGEQEDEEFRYATWVRHRSRLTEKIWLHVNADWMHDPEIYYDILDHRERNIDRRRLYERNVRTALSWIEDDWLLRALYERTERIGRDRVTNYVEIGDDDDDFDPDDDLRDEVLGFEDDDDDDEGISSERYGTVTEREPQITLATSWINILRSQFYYNLDLNVFNNLDKGLNTLGTSDDSMVRGVDLYQRIMFYHRFTKDTNIIAKLGAGIGRMERQDDTFDFDFPSGSEFPGTPYNNGLEFVDEETFLVGDEEFNLQNVDDNFTYFDSDIQLHHRFTRAIRGGIKHFIRVGGEDSLGEFYEASGAKIARNDLYDYRYEQHWINAYLRYSLAVPDLTVRALYRRNLESKSERSPNDTLQSAAIGLEYNSPRDVYRIDTKLGYSTQQVRHPDDEFAYERDSINYRISTAIRPLHNNWWGEFAILWRKDLDDDPADLENEDDIDDDDDDDDFDESDDDIFLNGRFVTRIGPKWSLEFTGDYEVEDEDINRVGIILKRDLHDAVLNIEFFLDDDIFDDDDNDNDNDDDDNDDDDSDDLLDNLEIRVALTFKLPKEDFLKAQAFRSALDPNREAEEDK